MRVFAIVCIVLGAGIIFLSDEASTYDGYLKIVGFILLMFGLYKCTKFWVKDNKEVENEVDDSDDHQDIVSKN
ncbi:hypothetical protein [Galbibacter sp.]|jgi:hypothetical protein|uniref:hypothetical protein n=1 Tax=Galbibacter sp. TaxID=2918471 RepID=UPI003A927E54